MSQQNSIEKKDSFCDVLYIIVAGCDDTHVTWDPLMHFLIDLHIHKF